MNIKDVAKYAALLAGLFGFACAYAEGNEQKLDHDHLEAANHEVRQSALEYLIKENNTRLVKPTLSTRFRTVEEAVSHLRSQF